ncbi:MAG: GatB/YqeY domain-containing protein [Pseudarcicella sp.]|nr:GatB/YqeY domain-containing protein [Pseudarcicella sp.]MBP6409727.1 GatB/YqeY domain-containing protein [Pseudarcicella sp.]
MSLKETIENGIKDAMRAKDQDRLRTLRSIKSLILLEATSATSTGELTDDIALKLLIKAAKQRKDSLEIFTSQGRADLAEKEQIELTIIEEFLPKQLSEEDLKVKIQVIITQVGATGPADMGKVMGVATKEFAGLADGKVVSQLVKSLLS